MQPLSLQVPDDSTIPGVSTPTTDASGAFMQPPGQGQSGPTMDMFNAHMRELQNIIN